MPKISWKYGNIDRQSSITFVTRTAWCQVKTLLRICSTCVSNHCSSPFPQSRVPLRNRACWQGVANHQRPFLMGKPFAVGKTSPKQRFCASSSNGSWHLKFGSQSEMDGFLVQSAYGNFHKFVEDSSPAHHKSQVARKVWKFPWKSPSTNSLYCGTSAAKRFFSVDWDVMYDSSHHQP